MNGMVLKSLDFLSNFLNSSCFPPCSSDGTESACKVGDLSSIPGLGRSPWRREWQPTPVFLPGEFHGQRGLVGYSPWDCRELDTTERLILILLEHRTLRFSHSLVN